MKTRNRIIILFSLWILVFFSAAVKAHGFYDVKISEDRKYVVAGGADINVILYSINGEKLKTFPHGGWVHSVAITPEYIFSGARDGHLKQWDITTGKMIRAINEGSCVESIQISACGKYVFSCGNGIFLHEIKTGKQVKKIDTANGKNVGALSPDGRKCFTGSDGQVTLWDIETGEKLWTKKGHEAIINGKKRGWIIEAAFTPDGTKCISVSPDDMTAKVWDVKTGRLLLTITNDKQPCRAIAVSPNGGLCALGGQRGEIRIFSLTTGKKVKTLKKQAWIIEGLAFSKDGLLLASGSFDRSCILWNTKSWREIWKRTEKK